MRTFLDIGSHFGETVEVVLDPSLGFDRVVAFEPSKACLAKLEEIAARDSRLQICPFGLLDHDAELTLHNPGHVGASIYAGSMHEGETTERIVLKNAADWLRQNTTENEFIVAKLNCEGSEVAIVNSWLDAGLMGRMVSTLITFDILEFPDLAYQESNLRKRLRAAGLQNVSFSEDVMIGTTHERRIRHWLSTFGLDRPSLSRDRVERDFADAFRRYSGRSGTFSRLEHRFKQRFGYDRLPMPAKRLLRDLKRLTGRNRERDVNLKS